MYNLTLTRRGYKGKNFGVGTETFWYFKSWIWNPIRKKSFRIHNAAFRGIGSRQTLKLRMWARSDSFEALNMVLLIRNSISYSLFSEQSEIFTGFSNSHALLRLTQRRMRYSTSYQNEIPLLVRQPGIRFPFWWDKAEWDSPFGESTRNEIRVNQT